MKFTFDIYMGTLILLSERNQNVFSLDGNLYICVGKVLY